MSYNRINSKTIENARSLDELKDHAMVRIRDVSKRIKFDESITGMLTGNGVRGIKLQKITKTQRRFKQMDMQFDSFQDSLRAMSNVAQLS